MTTVGWLPHGAEALFGEGATAEDAYGLLTVDVPAESWLAALRVARDALECTYFDWLSAVDEPGTGFHVCAHVVALPTPDEPLRRLVLRTTVPHEAPSLPTATGIYAGASWHERETHEMFGVDFPDHPHLVPLLLPEGFEGHPLRKDFVLAARVVKAWPGAKEPGESGHGGPKRRTMLPPGVPDPNEWGPLKGQLPPAPARPARGRAAGAGAGSGSGTGAKTAASGERPARRTRSAGDGSANQRPPRRARSAGEGSASQRTEDEQPEQQGEPEQPGQPEPEQQPEQQPEPKREQKPGQKSEQNPGQKPEPKPEPKTGTGGKGTGTAPRSTDAPWHQAPGTDDGDTNADTNADANGDTNGDERGEDA